MDKDKKIAALEQRVQEQQEVIDRFIAASKTVKLCYAKIVKDEDGALVFYDIRGDVVDAWGADDFTMVAVPGHLLHKE